MPDNSTFASRAGRSAKAVQRAENKAVQDDEAKVSLETEDATDEVAETTKAKRTTSRRSRES